MSKGFVKKYWEARYKNGDNSGLGSYDEAVINFKASYVNSFIKKNNTKTVIELGCGDDTKEFEHDMELLKGAKYDLSLSLDVIYHLVEDEVFEEYMGDMFTLSDNVCLYTTNEDKKNGAPHVKHRNVEKYVSEKYSDFKLVDKTPFEKYNVMFLLYKRK